MRLCIGVAAVVAALVVSSAVWAALPTNTVFWDSDGTKSLTQDGWTLAGTVNDGMVKSRDFSSGQQDAGTNGVWHIKDDNSGGNAYMRMYKNTPQGVDQSQGLVMARIKFIGANAGVNGTFGYTHAGGNHSNAMCIRSNQLNWKTAEQGNATVGTVSGMDTYVYRVYAVRWYLGGTFDSWYSTTTNWSANPADWVQVVSGGGFSPHSALIDETGTARTGLFLGANGSSANTWEGNVDWIGWSKNSAYQLPWTWDFMIPEPTGFLTLGAALAGLLPMIRRRAK